MKPNTLEISYDATCDVVTIEGQKYSGQLFREFGGLMSEGTVFRLVKRDAEAGTLTFEKIASA